MKIKTIHIFLLAILVGFIADARANLPGDTTTVAKKKAKNIILLIGDGMGVSQIYAGYTANRGKLNLERFNVIGFSKTSSASSYVTDSGAGATAMSTGQKTYNGAIAVDTSGKALKTILEIAEENGLSTGLVSTSAITHATPASFIAHCGDRDKYEEIAADFLKTDIEVFIGGGKKYFENRKDKINLIEKFKNKGYVVTDSLAELENINASKLAGFTSWKDNPSILNGRGDMLIIGAKTAINILKRNNKGFFLMIEGSQIDWGGHENNTEYITSEMIDFDKVIGEVLDFAKKDQHTLVIVTADHETGGMGLNGGNIETGEVDASFTTGSHTSVMVPVFAYGPGAERFMGIYENNQIFYKMMNSLFKKGSL